MTAMTWNSGKQVWQKECSCCHKVFEVIGDKWDDAFKAMSEHFYGQRERWSRSGLGADDFQGRCKDCHSHTVHKRDYNGKTREEMLKEQDSKCAICSTSISFEAKTAAIDHNHTTRVIRGILCLKCNHGIGSFKENTEYLLNAIAYLEKHKCE